LYGSFRNLRYSISGTKFGTRKSERKGIKREGRGKKKIKDKLILSSFFIMSAIKHIFL
jgi:hypothetical protein